MDKIEAAFRENIDDKDSMNKDYEDIFIGKGINNTLKADLAYDKTEALTPDLRKTLVRGNWSSYEQRAYNLYRSSPSTVQMIPSYKRITAIKYWLIDQTPPSLESASAPEGPFQPGEDIPIVVTFSEPVMGSTAKITVDTVDGPLTLSAQETDSKGKTMTFLYPVQPVNNATGVKIIGFHAEDIFRNRVQKRIRSWWLPPESNRPYTVPPPLPA